MTTVLRWAAQYGIACVAPMGDATADEVIDRCRETGALRDVDGEEFCVQLRDDVGPELWTERALRRSLPAVWVALEESPAVRRA